MSSLGEIAVTIRAVNEATPEFEAVSTDAARMTENLVGSTGAATVAFNNVGVSANMMGANVRAAGASFTELGTHAEATEVKLTTVARAIGSVGMMGSGLISLASDFGMVDKETGKYMRTIMTVIMVIAAFARMKAYLTLVTTGQTAAVAVEGATTTASTGALSLSSIAHKVYAAACSIATAAQNALNISHATFLALTGVGIGVIIAAAAAVAVFASQMNSATSAVKEYNAAADETPTKTRGIQRAGEDSLYRRGVE